MKKIHFDKYDAYEDRLLYDALCGRKSGYLFQRYLKKNTISSMLKGIDNHALHIKRDDNVPGLILGAHSYMKNIDQYIHESKAVANDMKQIRKDNPRVFAFFDSLKNYLNQKGILLRPARYQGYDSSPFIIRTTFSSAKNDVILPHEDEAQLYFSGQSGFEIQRCTNRPIIGLNICVKDDFKSKLIIWNFKSNKCLRKKFNIQYTGYPYHPSILNKYQNIEIKNREGDLYFFDTRNIHSVISSKYNKHGKRVTVSFFISFLDKKTVIYWT